LRLVLSLGLILNGSGFASAAAMLHAQGPPRAAVVHEVRQRDNSAPCPEHSGAAPEQRETAASSSSHDPEQPEHDKPGCCGSAGCIATCLQHAPAAIVALWLTAEVPVHSVSVTWSDATHATPPLADRIRPPIV
jgi:hypothetical protein